MTKRSKKLILAKNDEAAAGYEAVLAEVVAVSIAVAA